MASTALKKKGVYATSEGSVPYDPQTNGAAENADKFFKGTLKANLLSLERQIQARIPLGHPASEDETARRLSSELEARLIPTS